MENINPTGKSDAYLNTNLEDILKGIFTIIFNSINDIFLTLIL